MESIGNKRKCPPEPSTEPQSKLAKKDTVTESLFKCIACRSRAAGVMRPICNQPLCVRKFETCIPEGVQKGYTKKYIALRGGHRSNKIPMVSICDQMKNMTDQFNDIAAFVDEKKGHLPAQLKESIHISTQTETMAPDATTNTPTNAKTNSPVAIVMWSANKTDSTRYYDKVLDLSTVMPKMMVMYHTGAFDEDNKNNTVTVKACNFHVEGSALTQFSLVNSWAPEPVVIYRHAIGDAARMFLSTESKVVSSPPARITANAAAAGMYTFGSTASYGSDTTSMNYFHAMFVSGSTAINEILNIPTFVENAERVPLIEQLDKYLLSRAFMNVSLTTNQNPTLMPHSMFQATEAMQPMFALFNSAC